MAGSLLALVLWAGAIGAEDRPRSGVISPDFDGKTVGARFIGLGESGTALAGMPESPLWNPAALLGVSRPLFVMDFDIAHQSRLSEDVIFKNIALGGRKLTYLAFAGPGGAFYYRPLASFKKRTVTNAADPANNFREETLKIDQLGIAVAQKSGDNYAMGLGISYINARRGVAVADADHGQPPSLVMASGNGFAADLGFLYKEDYLSFGAALFNIPGIIYWDEYQADQLPVRARVGLGFQPVPAFMLTSDYEKRYYRGGLTSKGAAHWGMEIAPLPWVMIRGGTFGKNLNDTDSTSYTGGFSVLSEKGHQIDFSFRTYRLAGERVYNYGASLIIPINPPNAKGR